MTRIQDKENHHVTSRQMLPTPMLPIRSVHRLCPPASPGSIYASSPISWATLAARGLHSPTPSKLASPRPEVSMLAPQSRVTFNEAVSVCEVTPAMLTYGENPAFFNFDKHGNKIHYQDAEGNTTRAPLKDLNLASPVSPLPLQNLAFDADSHLRSSGTPLANPWPMRPASPALQSPAQQGYAIAINGQPVPSSPAAQNAAHHSALMFCAVHGTRHIARGVHLPTDSGTNSAFSFEGHPPVWKCTTPSKAALGATRLQADTPHLNPYGTFRVPASPVSFGMPASPLSIGSPARIRG